MFVKYPLFRSKQKYWSVYSNPNTNQCPKIICITKKILETNPFALAKYIIENMVGMMDRIDVRIKPIGQTSWNLKCASGNF